MTAPTAELDDSAADAAGPQAAQPARRGRWNAGTVQRLGLLVVIVGLILAFGSANAAFYDEQLTVFPMLRQISIVTVVGLAQLAVMSIGHMNLAVGRMAAFSAMFMGLAYQNWGLPLYLGLLIGLLAGAAIGAFTGWTIAVTRVNSFVVTLAMDFALLGLVSLVYAQTTTAAAFTAKPAGMDALRTYSLAEVCAGPVCGSPAVPQLLLFTLVAMALTGYLYRSTRPGRELLLVGSNITAAELSGIPTGRRVIAAHALSGRSPRWPASCSR